MIGMGDKERERERERERDREREKERERERERERNVARLGDDCRHQKRLSVNNSAVSSGVVVERQECWVLQWKQEREIKKEEKEKEKRINK